YEHARRIAETQTNLSRIRQARHQLRVQNVDDHTDYDAPPQSQTKVAVISSDLAKQLIRINRYSSGRGLNVSLQSAPLTWHVGKVSRLMPLRDQQWIKSRLTLRNNWWKGRHSVGSGKYEGKVTWHQPQAWHMTVRRPIMVVLKHTLAGFRMS